jgi:hypothetical protein
MSEGVGGGVVRTSSALVGRPEQELWDCCQELIPLDGQAR